MVLIHADSELAFDAALVGSYVPSWEVTRHPTSGALSDHRERHPVEITWEVVQSEIAGDEDQSGPDHIAEALGWLETYGAGPLECVQDGLPTVGNLTVQEFPFTRSGQTGRAIHLRLVLVEVRIATTRSVALPDQAARADKASTFAEADGAGEQQATTAESKSLAAFGFDAVF